jgi:predicted aspartyl protease
MRASFSFDEDLLARVPCIVNAGADSVIVMSLIDTGADHIFIDSTVADYLNLEIKAEIEVGAAGGPLKAWKTRIPGLTLASDDFAQKLERKDVDALIISNLGEDLILGSRFFAGRAKLTFDYIEMKVVIESGR